MISMNKNKLIIFNICFILLILMFVSCSKSNSYKRKLNVPYQKMEPQSVEILEYNKALFAIDTANFEEEIRAIRPRFASLLGDSLDEKGISFIKDFVTDTFIMKINKMTEEAFPDIEFVSDMVKDVYQHLNYYYPEIVVPPTCTYVSGVNYENGPVMIGQENVMISLDYYLSNNDLIYDKIGMPRYMSRRCQPASLTKDLAEAIYYAYIYKNINTKNVIMEMIARGKKYFFIEAMNPSLPDSIILGYSSKQTEWVHEFEGNVWASIVGDNMLYSNTFEQYRVLFNDGPFTTAFSEDSPPRLGDFFGLQIVRSFMSNNDETLTNLMNITDFQDIFQRSQYKPRK